MKKAIQALAFMFLLVGCVTAVAADTLSVEAARQAREDGTTAFELYEAGYTVEQLKGAGYGPSEMFSFDQTIPLTEIGNAFNAKQLKQAGWGAPFIARAGRDINNLLSAGFTMKEIMVPSVLQAFRDNGQSMVTVLYGYIFRGSPQVSGQSTLDALLASGFKAEDFQEIIDYFKNQVLHGQARGSTQYFMSIITEDGGLAQLRELGISAQDIRDAASFITPSQYVEAGYSVAELKAVGMTASELMEAGVNPAKLKDAGYTPAELKEAGVGIKQLKQLGYTARELRRNGFGLRKLLKAGFDASALKEAGFKVAGLKNHFTLAELLAAGFTPAQLKAAGFTDTEIAVAQERDSNSGGQGDSSPEEDTPLVWPTNFPSVPGTTGPGNLPGAYTTGPTSNIPDIPSVVEQTTNNDSATQSTGSGATETELDD